MAGLVEIFKAGSHVAMDGSPVVFGPADLAATVAAYDIAEHEAPVVIGHPESDGPAYAWVRRLEARDGVLIAELGDVDPEFADLVRARRYAKISASFYRPGAPGNPRPGVWSLRHVGFLGAMPPAVKGLRPAQFGASRAGVVGFAAAVEPIAAPAERPGQFSAGQELARAAWALQAEDPGLSLPSAVRQALQEQSPSSPLDLAEEADSPGELARRALAHGRRMAALGLPPLNASEAVKAVLKGSGA